MTSDAALTGGSGLVGGHLLRSLVGSGLSVTAIVRSTAAAEKVSADGATPVVVDLFDGSGLQEALWGIPVVYHVAGVNETCPSDPAEMDHVNIEGTRSIIAASATSGVGRIVYTSSAAAIGEAEGMIGTESTKHDGTYLSPYARSKHLAEVVAFTEASTHGVDLVAVNPSSVQGPGRSGGSARILLYALRAKRPVLVDTKVSLIDIEDCTQGHRAAATKGRSGERYLLSGATVSVSDAIAMAQEIAATTITPRWLSAGVARAVGRPAAGVVNLVRPSADVCPALIDTLLHGHRFDGSRAERDLGIIYTPIEDTLRRTIEWFVEQGLVPSP